MSPDPIAQWAESRGVHLSPVPGILPAAKCAICRDRGWVWAPVSPEDLPTGFVCECQPDTPDAKFHDLPVDGMVLNAKGEVVAWGPNE